jgi:hypothetical protein
MLPLVTCGVFGALIALEHAAALARGGQLRFLR